MTTIDLQSKYTSADGDVFMTGVQALVRVLFDQMRLDKAAGLRTAVFASGYPGSPLGGFDRELAAQSELFAGHHVVHQPGHNEDLAATSVMGSQISSTFEDRRYDGVLGVWYGKAPGLDRSGDAIRHAQYAGTSRLGGAVAYVGDDPACKSSSIPGSSEYALRDLELPILHPGSVQEILELGLHAVALSRFSGLWTAVRVVSSLADGTATARVAPDRVRPIVPAFEWNGVPFAPRQTPRPIAAAAIEVEDEVFAARVAAAAAYGVANDLNRVTVGGDRARVGIAASGQTYYEVLTALRKLGLDERAAADSGIRLLQVRMLYPLDRDVVRRFARGLDEIVVIEEKRPFLETAIRDALYGASDQPIVTGKLDPDGRRMVPLAGTLDADRIAGPLHARLSQYIAAEQIAAPEPVRQRIPLIDAARTPYFCAGCPHSTSTQVPEGASVGAGIGCHGIALMMDPDRVGDIVTSTHMGGEGAQWIGIEPFVERDHLFQNIGDGTYFHSGQLAVQAAVAAGAHITFKLLYNGAIAMTGGQAPATSNARPVPDVAEMLVRQGVARVLITTEDPRRYRGVRLPRGVDVWDRSRIVEAQSELAATPGVTVLIHDQQCATELRRDRKRGRAAPPTQRVFINERVCEGCGDCGAKSNCLAVEPVETEFGRKTAINQSSCNVDLSCLAGDCPSFVTVTDARPRRWSRTRRGAGDVPPTATDEFTLPEPTLAVDPDDVTIRMPGIGGTGVVTVNQLLGTAALLDGKHVAGLDQTGLSQKAGPVVSDLRITSAADFGSNKVSSGSVAVYLVFDLLVGLAPSNLDGVSDVLTHAVVSTSRTPTGAMVTHVDAEYPDDRAMLDTLAQHVRPQAVAAMDSIAIVRSLLGSTATANLFIVGVAYQRGLLPLRAESIEAAIELNGVAVDANKLTFRWGRQWAVDASTVEAAVAARTRTADRVGADAAARLVDVIEGITPTSRDTLVRRTADLIAYQNERYARRYVDLVRRVAAAERRAAPQSERLVTAVANGMYKLMAYKDEYEVARLHLDEVPDDLAAAAAGGRVHWHLHPPVLRALGMNRKLRLGPAFTPVLRGLRAMRRLRGTPFDVFGYAEMRRTERALVDEYEATITSLTDDLDSQRLERAIEVAGLPDLVRGYEQIKADNIERYRERMHALLADLRAPDRPGVPDERS